MAQVTPDRQVKDDIERLRGDIERVRDELGQTLGELEERASPKRIAERSKARLRERVDGARRSAGAVVRSADRRVLIGGAAVLAALVVVRLVRH